MIELFGLLYQKSQIKTNNYFNFLFVNANYLRYHVKMTIFVLTHYTTLFNIIQLLKRYSFGIKKISWPDSIQLLNIVELKKIIFAIKKFAQV